MHHAPHQLIDRLEEVEAYIPYLDKVRNEVRGGLPTSLRELRDKQDRLRKDLAPPRAEWAGTEAARLQTQLAGGRSFQVTQRALRKDATVRWDVIREHGVFGRLPFVQMRTPGFGDSDWTRVISELRLSGYKGSIDIEGWHDPVYRGDLEITGQVRALEYLKQCRGGADYLPNPV